MYRDGENTFKLVLRYLNILNNYILNTYLDIRYIKIK